MANVKIYKRHRFRDINILNSWSKNLPSLGKSVMSHIAMVLFVFVYECVGVSVCVCACVCV